MMNTSVVVVGSYVQDLAFSTPAFPRPGETVIGEFKTGPGGKGSNQAIAAARAGAATSFIGAIGTDTFADVASGFHQKEGVTANWLQVNDVSTGAASIVVNREGQNEIVVALGACNRLDDAAVQFRMPDQATVVVTQLETHLGGSRAALETGRRLGALTVLNPAPMRDDFPADLLESVDVLIPNETEFIRILQLTDPERFGELTESDLAGKTEDELHQLCRCLPVPTTILTLGERGALLSTAESFRHFPVLQDLKVVDTTGAGDAFVGGFAAGWCRFDQDVEAAVRYGVVVSGLSVTRPGTAPAMPVLDEIESALQRYPS